MQDQNNIIAIVFGLMLLLNVAIYCGGLLQHNQMHSDYKALLKRLDSGTVAPPQITIERDTDSTDIRELKAGIGWLADKYRADHAELLLEIRGLHVALSAPQQATIPAISAGSLVHEPKRSLDRESIQLQRAVALIMANDTSRKLTDREAANLANVSHSTINRAWQWIKSE